MALTDDEKIRVRTHLGYLNTQPAAAITFGTVVPLQTLFLVDSAMEKILPGAEDRVRRILGTLDHIEELMVCALPNLAATSMDGIELRADQIDQLEHEYDRWSLRLAELLGVPRYPGSRRFNRNGMPGFHNVLVSG